MNERELGKAMLRREADVDAKAIADTIVRRDRRRIWSMTFGCVMAWLAVVAIAWGTILPMIAKVAESQLEATRTATLTAAEQREHALGVLRAMKTGTVATAFGSVITTLIAAICTVRLITFSRTSTLRQVNARLDEISAQIKLLASSPPK